MTRAPEGTAGILATVASAASRWAHWGAAVAKEESDWAARSVHPGSSATGVWQVVPGVLDDFNKASGAKMVLADMLDPHKCWDVWRWYWAWLSAREYCPDWRWSAYAYVCGPGRVKAAVAAYPVRDPLAPVDRMAQSIRRGWFGEVPAEAPWEWVARLPPGADVDPMLVRADKLAYVRRVSTRAAAGLVHEARAKQRVGVAWSPTAIVRWPDTGLMSLATWRPRLGAAGLYAVETAEDRCVFLRAPGRGWSDAAQAGRVLVRLEARVGELVRESENAACALSEQWFERLTAAVMGKRGDAFRAAYGKTAADVLWGAAATAVGLAVEAGETAVEAAKDVVEGVEWGVLALAALGIWLVARKR